MNGVLNLCLEGLIDLTQKYQHSIFRNYFSRRHSHFIYIGICSKDWLENTRLRSKIEIIEFSEIVKVLIKDNEANNFNSCLDAVYNNGDAKTFEPYRSIARKLLKNVVEEFLSMFDFTKKIKCFLVEDYRIFDLLPYKNKHIYIPMTEILTKDIAAPNDKAKYELLKTIIKIDELHNEKPSNKFNDISELDQILFDDLNLKDVKQKKQHVF